MPLRIAALIVLGLLATYGVIKGAPLLSGPNISLVSPTDGETFNDGFVKVEGVAERTEHLELNGSPLLIDESGHFSTILTLSSGGAILSLTASDRFGKSQSVTRAIYVP
jgi:hypothetical protein